MREKQAVESSVSLRLVEAADEDFLVKVYLETRRDELAPLGWSAEQQELFCAMQFRLQTAAYRMQFANAVSYVVELCEHAAGRLIVSHDKREIRLVDVSLLPEFRNQGVGKILVKQLQREAEAADKPLNLSVLRTNSAAIRLYERLGFAITESSDTHLAMQWSANE